MKKGTIIRVIRMDDQGGRDWQATKMNGIIAAVDYIDSAGQIHLTGYDLAIIPDVDEYEEIK